MKQENLQNTKLQLFIKNIKENKYALILVLIGYFLFIFDNHLLKNITNLFSMFKGWLIVCIYFFTMLISYIEVKVFIRIYKKYTIKEVKTFFNKISFIFIYISIGSLLGFTVNILQALIIVTFNKYILNI